MSTLGFAHAGTPVSRCHLEWGPNPLVVMDPGGPYLLSRFGPGSPYLLVDMGRGPKSTGVQINWDTGATLILYPLQFFDIFACVYTDTYKIQRSTRR